MVARKTHSSEEGLVAREEGRLRRAEEELRRRDAILEAVRFAADQFLGEAAGWEQSVSAVLRRLGEATEASRVYVFENYPGEDGEPWATQRYEWVARDVSAQITNPLLRAMPYKAAGFARWAELLGRGDLVHGHVRDLPESEQPELRFEEILSIALVPIFVEGRWWGFIGFDECTAEREWSAAEISALGAAAGTLGAAIRRRQTDERLRQSEERYRAVVEQATDGIFLLDVDTRRIVEANPAFCRMFGYNAAELGEVGIYDLVAHPRADVDATISRTLARGRRLVGERRYRRKDGELLDVDIGASVISYGGKRAICTIVRDVTERRRAEAALRESEERFRSAFESAAVGMAIVRLDDGRWLEANRPLCEMLGYPESELLATTFTDVTHPEDVDPDLRQTARLISGEIGSFQMEKRYIHKDGHVVWALLSASLVHGADGRPLYGIAQIEDITARKQAEEALAHSESRLRAIVETEPECVKVLGMDGTLLEMNSAGLAMIEADSIEQVRGKPVYEYIAPEHRTDFVALTERVLGGGSGMLEFELCGLKGTRRWLETHAVPLREAPGEISGLLGITRDITERKRAEQALKQSEELYRTVIEQATENIFLVDVQTRRVVETNAAFRRTLGYSEEELGRMKLYDVVAASHESVDENIRRVLLQRDPSVGERKYRRKDGTLLHVEVSASIILRDGRQTVCAVAHDITERARTQRLLEDRLGALSRLGARLTLDLPVQDTLDTLTQSIVNASTAVACSVALTDEANGSLRIEGSYGLPEEFVSGIEAVWREGTVRSPTLEAVRSLRPALASHMRQRMLESFLYAPVHEAIREVEWDTVFIVPLVSRGRSMGAINFAYLPGQEPGENERAFLTAAADQAAIAIENSRLLAEARGKAALEERQRLARELHDSVSQALYGIALGLETARELLDRDPRRAAEPLDYAFSLTEAGMTEMRALIFELRPDALEKEGLVTLLRQQASAIEARHRIEVETRLCAEPKVSLEAKETLYRVAQESLHNTVKHARASRVSVEMECDSGSIALRIHDDGVGFDACDDFPGHLGLRSMRERVSRLGGSLELESAPGAGTRVGVSIPG